jgi:hypothetical protein
MTKTPKRPRDTNQLAKFVLDLATGDEPVSADTSKVVRARKAGTAGGPARARALSQPERSEIARIAAVARWKKGG